MTSNQESKDIIDALGGKRGILDSGIPSLVFVLDFTWTRNLGQALLIAVSLAVVLTIIRIIRRTSVQHAISGLVGVLICAWFSRSTGKAENFFLPGMVKSGIYGAVYLFANIIRWPLLGVILGPILGENLEWKKSPERLNAYLKVGWVWVGMFAVRLLIQIPLYLAGQVSLLGVATLVVGWPLFLATCYATYLILRKTPTVKSD